MSLLSSVLQIVLPTKQRLIRTVIFALFWYIPFLLVSGGRATPVVFLYYLITEPKTILDLIESKSTWIIASSILIFYLFYDLFGLKIIGNRGIRKTVQVVLMAVVQIMNYIIWILILTQIYGF